MKPMHDILSSRAAKFTLFSTIVELYTIDVPCSRNIKTYIMRVLHVL